MRIRKSGAKYSAIVGIGERIRKMSQNTGKEYLLLNRGVNSVCNIDLNSIVEELDFNSNEMQVYPPSQGRSELRNAINQHYFNNKSSVENIAITGGGMSALDLVFQTIHVEKVCLPDYYWGSYVQVMTVRGIDSETYLDLGSLKNNVEKYRNSAVVICDPNNPIGNKQADDKILETAKLLSELGVIVIIDCPYRRIFCGEEDLFFQELSKLDNIVIVESFSKSVGLSGQRLGFVHSTNKEFMNELGIRLMYATNGINAFSQLMVAKLLSSDKGQVVMKNFKNATCEGIRKNIAFLQQKGLLAEEFYKDSNPVGIFVIVNKSEEELLDAQIGSVSLSYFTRDKKEYAARFARICVSVPHEKFKKYFEKLEQSQL
jgi:aspartate/methionine/tyrosine aminotransferase